MRDDSNHKRDEIPPEGRLVPLEFAAYTIRKDETEDLSHVAINPQSPTSGGVVVKYNGLGGNLPKTYKNSIALWLGSVPNMQGGFIMKVDIDEDDQAGDVLIKYPFQPSYYSLTYQVGESLETMCALAQLDTTGLNFHPKSTPGNQAVEMPGDDERWADQVSTAASLPGVIGDADPAAGGALEDASLSVPTYVELKILELTTNSVKVFYSTLPGYRPAKYKNWIGVWQGYAVPYNVTDPMNSKTISEDFTQGTVILDNVSFSQPFTYTLIYFTGPDRANAASLMYFDTGEGKA